MKNVLGRLFRLGRKTRVVIAMVLVLSICTQVTCATNNGKGNNGKDSKGGKKHSERIIDENFTEYLVSTDVVDINNFSVEFLDEKGKNKIEIVCSNGILQKTEYKITGTNKKGNNKYKKVKEECFDIGAEMEMLTNMEAVAAGYGKTVSMTLPFRSGGKSYYHYYRIGTSNPDIGYVEIGCVHVYRLKSDAKYFKEYKEKVDEHLAELNKAGCTSSIAVIALGIFLLSPSKAASAVAVAALGLDFDAILHLWNAKVAYNEADTYFDLAKAYGTKIR